MSQGPVFVLRTPTERIVFAATSHGTFTVPMSGVTVHIKRGTAAVFVEHLGFVGELVLVDEEE